MITAEIRAYNLRVGTWVKLNQWEVSTIKSLAVKPNTTIVRFTNGLRLHLNTAQSYLDEILMM